MNTDYESMQCVSGSAILCEPLERRFLLSGGGIYNEGILTIVGTTLGNEIHVSYTHEGVAVRVDGEEELFREPVHTIAIDAGDGNNTVQYEQFVVADIDLSILTGDGDDQVQVWFDLLAPEDSSAARGGSVSASWDTLAVSTFIDTGAGSDVVDFRWDSTNVPSYNAYMKLTLNGSDVGAEQGNEVRMAFEHGDARQPYVLGLLWNGQGGDRESGPDHRSLVLEKQFTPRSVDVDLQLTGGTGRDEVDLQANYTGVRLQQGLIALKADLNEGDNHFGGYIVTSARHMHVESSITAGDGDNLISMELAHVVQQGAGRSSVADAAHLSRARLGDGSNIVQFRETSYDFLHRWLELGDGDNVIDLTTDGVRDVDLIVTAGDGNNHTIWADPQKPATGERSFFTDQGNGDNTIEIRRGGFAGQPQDDGVMPKVEVPNLKISISMADGDNSILIADELGGNHEYAIDLGDGDNRTELRFGDGEQGRRPPAGQNNVTATYRTGAGNNTLEIHGDTRAPVAAEFLLDLGDGHNDVVKRWNFTEAWPSKWKGPAVAPSQTKVIITGNAADQFDMRIKEQPPEEAPRKPAEFVVIAIGQKIQGTIAMDVYTTSGEAVPGRVGSGGKPMFVPVRRFMMHDISAEELSLDMTDGKSSVGLHGENITLNRGVIESNAVALETLKLANEGWHVQLDGLDVAGSFSLDMDVVGPAASLALWNVQADENSSCWIRVSQAAGGATSLDLRNLRVDGVFAAELKTGDSSTSLGGENFVLGEGKVRLYAWDAFLELDGVEGDVNLDDLNVFGSFSLEQTLHGRGVSSTILRDVHVHEGARADFYDALITEVTIPALDSAFAVHNLQVDGVFGAKTQRGDITFDMVMSGGATLQNGTFTVREGAFYGNVFESRATFTMTDLIVSGWYSTSLNVGDSTFDMAMAGATVGYTGIQILDISDPANPRSAPAKQVYFEITLKDVLVSGTYSTSVETGGRGAPVSYIQDRVVTEAGATMDVRLSGGGGNDVILALLRDIAGDGSYSFTADGVAGDNFIAVLARDLDPGDTGSMSFEVRGGEGDDILALAVLAPTVRGDGIFARINGGGGFNRCFATSNVLVENCDEHLSERDIRRLLRRFRLFPAEELFGLAGN